MQRGHDVPGPVRARRSPAVVPVTLLFAALTLAMTYPLWVHPASTLLTTGADTDLLLWILSWDAHAFLHQPFAIFDTNIYYPYRDTLAFAENLIGTAFFSAPIQWLTGNPVLALNAVSLLSCMLCGIGAWVLGRRIGLGHAAAVLAGVVFAFGPPRFLRIEQLHLATVQWIPFGLASLHAYLDHGRRRDLTLTALFFMLQALSSGHGAIFMLLACGGLLLYRVALGEPVRPWRWLRDLGISGALLLLPVALAAIPYRRVRTEMSFQRDLLDWGVAGVSFLASPTYVHAWLAARVPDAQILEHAGAYLFPGILPLVLAAAALLLRPAFALTIDDGLRRGRPATVRGPEDGIRRRTTALEHTAGAQLDTARWWQRAAAALELLAAGLTIAALALTIFRPARVRLGDTVLFTARSLWRPWFVALVPVTLRVALVHRVPFEIGTRLRRWGEAWRRLGTRHRTNPVGFYGTLTLVATWLSIGPPFGIWPLVFRLPGFDTIRVPSRFTILGMLGLAMLAGIGFERISDRWWPARRRAAAFAAGAWLLAEFCLVPLEVFPSRGEIPAIDRAAAALPATAVIAEVPVVDPADALRAEGRQAIFMLHSTAHWRKTIHGYSGFRSPMHTRLYEQLWRFPSEQSLRSLIDFGVTHVIVHVDAYDPADWRAVEAQIGRLADRLRLERVEGSGRIYALRRPAVR
jgi:hypothetical protein